jgi:Zn ribbon nucleic-acid-binding protein/very-short-patch-repair endonuclease
MNMNNKRKTTDQFKSEVGQLVSDEYSVTGEYINNIIKITIKHNICGTEFLISPVSFLAGQRCPKCSLIQRGLKRRSSTEKFKQKVRELVGNDYSVFGEYVKAKTCITIKHNICGLEYEISPDGFIHGSRCPECTKNNRIRLQTKEDAVFRQQVKELVCDEYSVMGSYQNTHSKIKIKHNICGFEYDVEPNKFLHGRRCPRCAGKTRDTEQFTNEVYNLVKDEYSVLGAYKATAIKIKMKHNTCGREYYVTPNKFLGGRRCPHCLESKGERAIYEYLTNNNYTFKSEYKIKNCKNIKPLPFDFAIFNNHKLILLVEYDGMQHYAESWHGNKLERTKINDLIRDEYCKANNIDLLRIPYYEYDNVNTILDNWFEKYNIGCI